ncbi:SH3 and cysteine-rich domain-containing protein 2-like isoform X1 [Pseudochaenichthys georgianus]|uniref:SH3 and cysteine-rich domain-containing protein 2-like isoform X1 n=1 Tax=Pseudochaenichthys georgianus TaxID=52239 RepID=UPI00146B8DD5|nr:SH3 and cysteine-rich domain-containing protein 2-like isoform X1 [Pseudochaenichthys georgianus]
MTEISEKENEPQNRDFHRTQPTVPSQQESKLQRLKRSLSFKSVMRSKSMDNFFQRNNGESRPPSALITSPTALPCPPPPISSSPLAYERSPSHSPSTSPNLSLSSRSPSISPSLSMPSKNQLKSPVQPLKTHCFQEHVFRRPTSCQGCKHMIQGNSKQGLRCRACKLATHLWCSSELSQQPCNGKSGAFKRNFSSPLLTADTLGVVREAPAAQEADNSSVDPVYEALRYGTSLAQLSRSSFSSISESPCDEEENLPDILENQPIAEEEPIPGMLTPPESEKADSEDRVSLKTPKKVEVHSIHTYVALYKFLPQEKNDLELQPGDRVQVTDDSNEDWWKGKSRDKVGLFPANFVQRVRPGERVWKVTDGFHGNRDKGQMTVKEAQICVGKNEEIDGFLRLSSGKKRGLVPLNYLLEI